MLKKIRAEIDTTVGVFVHSVYARIEFCHLNILNIFTLSQLH